MTMGIFECVLFLGMVGLIWMMLDLFGDNHYTDDTRQESASPDPHNSRHQPAQPSHASQGQQMMVFLPVALIERLRSAAYWTGDRPLVDLVAEAIEDLVTQMEETNEEGFHQSVSPLKREAMTRTALSGPLR